MSGIAFSVGVASEGNKLIVNIPGGIVGTILWLLPMFLWIGAYRLSTTPKARTGALIAMAVNILIAGIGYTPAKVVLDAASGKANISTMMLLVPHHQTIPLSEVGGATVRFSEGSQALAVVLGNGQTIQLTPFNQQRGVEEAAAAINLFIQSHGGAASPQ